MKDLELSLSNLVGFPVSVSTVKSEISHSKFSVPDIKFDIHCVPGKAPDVNDDDIPFCDLDCDCCGYAEEEFDPYPNGEPTMWGIPDVEYVIFNPPATIVFWSDGTKTVVKAMEGETYEKYAGFAMACMKKMFGSTSRAKAIMNENNFVGETEMRKTCKNCRYFDYVDKWCSIIGESKNKNNECNAVDDEGNLFWTEGKIQDWAINYGMECCRKNENKLENQVMSSVKQEDCADIMNKINDALEGTGYQATAFDNTGSWLCVIIEG